MYTHKQILKHITKEQLIKSKGYLHLQSCYVFPLEKPWHTCVWYENTSYTFCLTLSLMWFPAHQQISISPLRSKSRDPQILRSPLGAVAPPHTHSLYSAHLESYDSVVNFHVVFPTVLCVSWRPGACLSAAILPQWAWGTNQCLPDNLCGLVMELPNYFKRKGWKLDFKFQYFKKAFILF